MQHSNVVGGSTAKRVIKCPGSVALCRRMPPQPSSSYADEGTLCHSAMEAILTDTVAAPEDVIGMTYKEQELTEDLFERKIQPALAMFDRFCNDYDVEFDIEKQVGYPRIPGAFGTSDIIGFSHTLSAAVIWDWKFGDGVLVPAQDSDQLLYYAGGARETADTAWIFDKAEELILAICQPGANPDAPSIWRTTPAHLDRWVKKLILAVELAEKPDAPVEAGDWCRWCAAKPICPVVTGAIDRAMAAALDEVDTETLGALMAKADLAREWATSVEQLARQVLDSGRPVPGYKLVAKRATRKWIDEATARAALRNIGLDDSEIDDISMKSPAQVEKVLKKHKLEFPDNIVSAVSSGNTIASADDPRPAVVLLGQQFAAALSKLG